MHPKAHKTEFVRTERICAAAIVVVKPKFEFGAWRMSIRPVRNVRSVF